MDESPGKMYALTAVFMTIALIAVPLRFYTRRMQSMKPGLDDWLMLPALLLTLSTGVAIIIGSALGDLGRHTLIENGMVVSTTRTVVFEKATFYTLLSQTLTFGLTKVSVLWFYKRVFRGRGFTITIWTALVMVTCWTIAFFLANLLQCVPIWIRWTGEGFDPQRCIDENAMYLAQASTDVITDVGILAIPLPWLWKLQMPWRRKVALSCIFLLGSLVVVAGIAKAVAFNTAAKIFASGNLDLTYYLTPTQYWPMMESSLGILGACLPIYRPLFRRFDPSTKGRSTANVTSGHSNNKTRPQRLRSKDVGIEEGTFELLRPEDSVPSKAAQPDHRYESHGIGIDRSSVRDSI